MILAGDIGGTKTHLGLFELKGGKIFSFETATYTSRRYEGLESMIREFLSENPREVTRAAFGVAGPVTDGVSRPTNLPWSVSAKSVAHHMNLKQVILLNDLVANAWGIAALGPKDTLTLNAGARGAEGNRALLSAGTGLGEAHLFWDGKNHFPSASEGGHVDFAPRGGLERELLSYLEEKFKRVSYERVLSGPGIFNIYSFLRDSKWAKEPSWLKEALVKNDSSAVITEMALRRRQPLCVKTLDLFVDIYGAQAGNVALAAWATGGVFIGGGIAPKILKKIKDGRFLKAFLGKGRLSVHLERMPVRVILNDKTALLGAALHAAHAISH